MATPATCNATAATTTAPVPAWPSAISLESFRPAIPALSCEERLLLVRSAIGMLEDFYVHLPQKLATHGLDPIARLRALYRQVPALPSDAGFHSALAEIFDGLSDLHTNYLLPSALACAVAVLPIQLGEYEQDGIRHVIITAVADGFMEACVGDEVLFWHGTPIQRALERKSRHNAGANPPARRAQALASLTIRPLAKRPPPDEDWVLVQLVTESGAIPELRMPWRVLTLPFMTDRSHASVDLQADVLRRARRMLFPAPTRPGTPVHTDDLRCFTPARLGEGGDALGYLRINTFLVKDASAFQAEMIAILARLPPRGLVLDVRDNGGGLVEAAERCLQLFTPHPIEPAPMQLRATPAVLALCEAQEADLHPTSLGRWTSSVQHALTIGALYSSALPMTPPALCNAVGQHYSGPVVLLTNAFCYSATDIFAGGFQDHAIGPVLGVHTNTGAGGANVWPYSMLQTAQDKPPGLPGGAELRVALRRSLRVGPSAGLELEERGVVPDVPWDMTRRDLLEGDIDLLARARALLLDRPWRQLEIEALPAHHKFKRKLRIHARHTDWVNLTWNGRPLDSHDINTGAGGHTIEVEVPSTGTLAVHAVEKKVVVASRTVILR